MAFTHMHWSFSYLHAVTTKLESEWLRNTSLEPSATFTNNTFNNMVEKDYQRETLEVFNKLSSNQMDLISQI